MTSTGWDWTTRVWSAVLLSGLVSNSILSKDDAVSPIEATSDGIISCCLRPVIYQCSNFASTLQSNEEKRSITNKILHNITVWSTNFPLKKTPLRIRTMSIIQSWSPNSLAWHLTTHGVWDSFFSLIWFIFFVLLILMKTRFGFQNPLQNTAELSHEHMLHLTQGIHLPVSRDPKAVLPHPCSCWPFQSVKLSPRSLRPVIPFHSWVCTALILR